MVVLVSLSMSLVVLLQDYINIKLLFYKSWKGVAAHLQRLEAGSHGSTKVEITSIGGGRRDDKEGL